LTKSWIFERYDEYFGLLKRRFSGKNFVFDENFEFLAEIFAQKLQFFIFQLDEQYFGFLKR